jgi:uncharacterized membrane protein
MKRKPATIKNKIIHESTPERLNAFSVGVFAIIITIMVLELKRPSRTILIFGTAMLVALWHPYIGFGIDCACLALYLRPDVPGMKE